MRIVFAGTPDPAVVALQHLIDSKHDVVGVITRPDAKKGRGRTMHPSPVAALAEKHAIPMVKPTSLKPGTEDGDNACGNGNLSAFRWWHMATSSPRTFWMWHRTAG